MDHQPCHIKWDTINIVYSPVKWEYYPRPISSVACVNAVPRVLPDFKKVPDLSS